MFPYKSTTDGSPVYHTICLPAKAKSAIQKRTESIIHHVLYGTVDIFWKYSIFKEAATNNNIRDSIKLVQYGKPKLTPLEE